MIIKTIKIIFTQDSSKTIFKEATGVGVCYFHIFFFIAVVVDFKK